MYSILAWQISILDSMNDKIRSRGLYLPTVAVVVGDADGGDDGTRSTSKSSMRGGGIARRSWRRIRRDVAPPDLDGRWPVVKVRSSRMDSAFQKTLFVFSQCRIIKTRVPQTCSSSHYTRKRSDWSSYGGSVTTRIGKKNSSSIRYILAWPVGCLYSPVQPTSCRCCHFLASLKLSYHP
jgi:hypothetical protein